MEVPMTAYLIMTGCDHGAAYAECDQIVETLALAKREKADLVKMGCGEVRIYEFENESAAQDYVDEKDARWPKGAKRV
jgi:hypothetical protein